MKGFIQVCILILISESCVLSQKNNAMKIKFDFYTSHHQFYLADKLSNVRTDSESFWTEQAYNIRLASEKGVLGVLTESYGTAMGEIIVLDHPDSENNFNSYDHVVEGYIEIKSGELLILDCPNLGIENELKVIAGGYRVRIYSSNFSSVIDEDGEDYYKLVIWQSDIKGRKVLKPFNVAKK